MHAWILGGGLLWAAVCSQPALAAAAAPKAPAAVACPAATAPLIERLMAADCPDCWAAAGGEATATPGDARRWMLDWLLPRGADAPMAAAALPEATERGQRAGLIDPGSNPATGPSQVHIERPALPRQPGLALRVVSGPAWQGYFGLQLRIGVGRATRLPAGTTAWLALVEQIPAGTEGSTIARQLVRSVAGPLPLQALRHGLPFSHLQALRWPEGAQPARLQARGWLEAPDGRVLAMAADRCD